MRIKSSNLKIFLILSGRTFLLLVLIGLGLPLPFLLLRVPSFAIGDDPFWLLRWRNTTADSGIQLNIMLLFIIAIAVGWIGLVAKRR